MKTIEAVACWLAYLYGVRYFSACTICTILSRVTLQELKARVREQYKAVYKYIHSLYSELYDYIIYMLLLIYADSCGVEAAPLVEGTEVVLCGGASVASESP